MFSRNSLLTLFCVVLMIPSPAMACRVPHKSPEFDAQINLEYVSRGDRRFRFDVPAEMNDSPFFSIYFMYRVLGAESDESDSALEIEVTRAGDRVVGEFSLPDDADLSKSYLEVNYQGRDIPCGTVAIRAIERVE